jgi:CRISPR-associated protein Csd1
MILQSLYRYYTILSQDTDSDIAPPGYSSTGVSFALDILAQGELLNVFPLFEQVQAGKKTMERPRRMIVPEQVKRSSGIRPNFLCDNSAYVLGISDKKAADAEYSLKRFEAFREFNQGILAKADCKAARAVSAFLDNYDPHTGREHPEIARALDRLLEGGNLIFRCEGRNIHEDAEICRVWEEYKAGKKADVRQCLVTGEITPIAQLHPSVKGIRGANATGATLVGFNASAYESYHRKQGLNSPVSEKAAFGYTTALNYLLSSANPNRKFYLGDTTIVYWAESENKQYASAFASLIAPEYLDEPAGGQTGRKRAEGRMNAAAEKIKRAKVLDISRLTEGLDKETRFYVLGLAPNAARLAVRFFLTDPFGKIVDRIMRHYADMKIIKEFDDQPDAISVGQILNETVSKKSKDKNASPLMAGAVMHAILSGGPYPAALYYAIINRIRADMDDSQARIRKINYVRAAVIKAFLIRKYRNQPKHPIQEVLVMSLNEQSTHPAYVLGRLFAVLEKVQQEAVGDVNASIKDRYFTSACASPASVFPILLRLSQHHISKVGASYHDMQIEAILNKLDVEKNPIPARLSLDDQGVFILGYYHERKDLWTAKSKPSTETNESGTKQFKGE